LQSLEARVATYLSPPLFPVHLSDVPSRLIFHDVPDEPWELGPAVVTAAGVSHQGPTVGYRVESRGRSLAYIPDHEPSIGVDLRSLTTEWLSGYPVACGVDFLLHDAQYSEDEYPAHIGWGHSSIEHVVTIGQMAGVDQVVLFHHDPRHTDDELESLLARAVELWGGAPNPPVLAYEGMRIELLPDVRHALLGVHDGGHDDDGDTAGNTPR
jgi:phosphoribosyl 1,2-cyclic phosphodiesterase